ncbi:MAG: RNA polymerase subunit sigma [Clostridiales bacterium]
MVNHFNILDNNTVEFAVENIKKGNKRLRNEFIENYKPFIKKIVMEIRGDISFENIESTDEFSIALIAFNESIEKYKKEKNVNFFTFVAIVVKSRVYNYLNSNNKPNQFNNDKNTCIDELNIDKSDIISQRILTENEKIISYELEEFENELKHFKITIDDLIDSSPKHKDSRNLCFKIAAKIINDSELLNLILYKYKFPKNRIIKLAGVNKKTIERNRKFIIAVVFIVGNGFESLKNFISY